MGRRTSTNELSEIFEDWSQGYLKRKVNSVQQKKLVDQTY